MANISAANAPRTSLSATFAIHTQHVEALTLAFVANSLEAAPRLFLSTAPYRVRDLEDNEVESIDHLLNPPHNEELSMNISHRAIHSAVYIGRVRESRRVGEKYSDEPCLFLVFPKVLQKDDKTVQWLQERVIIPSFQRAYENYTVPKVGKYAYRPVPLSPPSGPRAERGGGEPTEYRVHAHLKEDWTVCQDDSENCDVIKARQVIHRLAWKYMEETILQSDDPRVVLFQGMILVVIVPETGNTGIQVSPTLWETLDLYDRDFNAEHLDTRYGDFSSTTRVGLTTHERNRMDTLRSIGPYFRPAPPNNPSAST